MVDWESSRIWGTCARLSKTWCVLCNHAINGFRSFLFWRLYRNRCLAPQDACSLVDRSIRRANWELHLSTRWGATPLASIGPTVLEWQISSSLDWTSFICRQSPIVVHRAVRTWPHVIFSLWGHVKNSVYVPPLPTNLELRSRITASIRSVTSEMSGVSLIIDWMFFGLLKAVILSICDVFYSVQR